MSRDPVLAAFGTEAARLAAVLLELPEADWSRPTRCPPWSVAGLVGHVLTAVDWLPDMLAAPAPARAEVTAAGYYRSDHRFSGGTTAARIGLAQHRAARVTDGRALALEFDDTCSRILRSCEREAPDRVVLTRHGDAMLLTDFVLTRVVELGIHGLDLADALGRPPWLTPAAAEVLTRLLLRGRGIETLRDLGWDELTFLHRATGRHPLTEAEARAVAEHDINWLTLG